MARSDLETAEVVRCPACGQRIEEAAPERCPLCGFDFGLERAATSDDATPFAEAYSHEQPGHRGMWKWVWTASTGRIKHLGLMRTSAAARSFSRLYWLLLSAGLGVLLATHYGWRGVTASALLEETGSIKPSGRGWLHVAAVPTQFRVTQAGMPVDLWWNPVQAVIAGVAGFLGGLILTYLVFALIQTGLRLAHQSRYREEGRMTAALHYSAAWSVPVLLAALILLVRPFGRIGAMARWPWYPGQWGAEYLAALVAAISFVFWWYWLFRLSSTAPVDSRGRVSLFVGLGVPLIVAAGATAWWLSLHHLLTYLFDSWKLRF